MDKDVVHINNGVLFSHKKNEIMPFAATWMDIGIIVLSEVSYRKTNIIWYHLYVESKKRYKQTYLQNRNRLTDRKQTYGYQEEREWDKFEIWDSHIHTTIY